jgi:acyl-CoA synthetase (NDP forming)
MTLARLFRPSAVAVVGASRSPTSIAGRLIPVLRDSRYSGAIYPINPVADTVDGLPSFRSLRALPEVPDVVLVVVKAGEALQVVADCVRLGVPNVIVHSSGFSETSAGRTLSQRLRETIARSGTRVLGPSSEGLVDTSMPIALGFSPAIDPARRSRVLQSGNAVILAQSGAVGFSLADVLSTAGHGIRAVVTTGNEADLEIADFLEFFAAEDDVGPVVAFLEHLADAPRFIASAQRLRARNVPVFACRVGSSRAGQRASLSHAGKVTGGGAAYSAVFAKSGAIEFRGVDDLVDLVAASQWRGPPTSRSRIAVVSGSGGAGIWLADALAATGLEVPELSAALQGELRCDVSPLASVGNPVDLTAQAVYDGSLPKVLAPLLATEEVDAVALVGGFAYSNWIIGDAAVKALLEQRKKPVVAFSYNVPSAASNQFLAAAKVPTFTDPVRASRALAALLSRRAPPQVRAQRQPTTHVSQVLDDGEMRRLLAAYGVALNERVIATDVREAATAVAALRFPLVMKLDTPSVVHKTDIGGVVAGIGDEFAAQKAARDLFARGHALGYTRISIERQIEGHEVLVAAVNDPVAGPMLVLGRGGVHVEAYGDVAHCLCPVSAEEARDALSTLAIFAVWRDGLRGTPAANVQALVDLIVAFSDAVTALDPAAWCEIECNPVIVNDECAIGVDLRLVTPQSASPVEPDAYATAPGE